MEENAAGRVIVLDIESVQDHSLGALAALPRGDVKRWCLHRVAAAALLDAERTPDGTWTRFDLKAWESGAGEEDVLEELDASLMPVVEGAATLVTYNGRRHDLEILRRRAGANLRMDLRALATLRHLPPGRHRDMMGVVCGNARDRLATLGDAIASMGIGIDHDGPLPFKVSSPPNVRKCQADVVATFLLHLNEAALDSGRAIDLLRGWRALADYLRPRARMWPHLAHFALHPNGRPAGGPPRPDPSIAGPVR